MQAEKETNKFLKIELHHNKTNLQAELQKLAERDEELEILRSCLLKASEEAAGQWTCQMLGQIRKGWKARAFFPAICTVPILRRWVFIQRT